MIWQQLLQWLRRLFSGRRSAPREGDRRRRRSRERRPETALSQFGARVGGHAGIYGAGNVGSLAVGLLTLAILTRFLPPAEFGLYSLFLVLGALLALLYNLGTQRGALRFVFGTGGDDDEDDDEDDGGGPAAPEGEKRRAMGTALVLTALVATVGTLALVAVAEPAATLLPGQDQGAKLVVLAALAGAFWAVWQLALTIPRRERRPKTYVLINLARPLLVLVATVPLLVAAPTVGNAVLGMALGTALAMLLALAVTRRSFRLAFSRSDAVTIARLGAPFIPMILSLWVISNASVFILAPFAAVSDIGLFRVAGGVAAIASYPVSAFLRAWGPLRREPIHGAVKAERGPLAAGGMVGTYFVVAAIGLMLGFIVLADLLVRIAPPAYAGAAPLIPLLGLGLLAQGAFRVVRRTAVFRGKRETFIRLAVLAAVVFLVVSFLLVPSLGTDGSALAIIAAFAVAAGGMLLRAQRGASPVPYGWRRMLAALAIAVGCYAAARLVAPLAGGLAPAIQLAALATYPLLLVATGVVPRAHVRPLGGILRSALKGRSPDRNGGVRLGELGPIDRAVLEVLIRHRQPVSAVAPLLGLSEEDVAQGFVVALRRAGGVGTPSAADARIGGYLLAAGPVAERDQIWRRLSADGADPLEADALSLTMERLRRAPAEAWHGG